MAQKPIAMSVIAPVAAAAILTLATLAAISSSAQGALPKAGERCTTFGLAGEKCCPNGKHWEIENFIGAGEGEQENWMCSPD
jgi:hypothetical protein